MKVKYIKEFFFFPDVLILSFIFFVSLGFTVTFSFNSLNIWIAVVLGMVTYVVSEYLTHRFLFHMKAPKNPLLLKMMKRLHYDHHTKPNELHLLFLPIWYSIPNLVIAAVIAYFITGSLAVTNAFLTGIIFFLLFYEWTHYVAHRPVQPKTRWGRWMKKVHIWHHFKNENYWYGVTNPSMDYVMGTFKNEKAVEKSQTAKSLEKRK